MTKTKFKVFRKNTQIPVTDYRLGYITALPHIIATIHQGYIPMELYQVPLFTELNHTEEPIQYLGILLDDTLN